MRGAPKGLGVPEMPENVVDAIKSSAPKHDGMFADLKINSTLVAGLQASSGVSRAPTAKATTAQCNQHRAHEFCVDGSGDSETMTVDATDFESHEREPPVTGWEAPMVSSSRWLAMHGCIWWWTKRTTPFGARHNR